MSVRLFEIGDTTENTFIFLITNSPVEYSFTLYNIYFLTIFLNIFKHNIKPKFRTKNQGSCPKKLTFLADMSYKVGVDSCSLRKYKFLLRKNKECSECFKRKNMQRNIQNLFCKGVCYHFLFLKYRNFYKVFFLHSQIFCIAKSSVSGLSRFKDIYFYT